MDSLSFAEHAKKTKAEEMAYRRKSRIRIAIIAVSASLLLLIIAAISATTIAYYFRSKSAQNKPKATSIGSIKAICSSTLYPDSCYSSISSARGPNNTDDNPEEVFKISVEVALAGVENATYLFDPVFVGATDPAVTPALRDCKELLGSAVGHLNETLAILQAASATQTSDIRTLLSAAVADQATCAEGLAGSPVAAVIAAATVNATQYTSNSLAIGTKFGKYIDLMQIPLMNNRRLLAATGNLPPSWASAFQRRTQQRLSERKLMPNVTVAKDGTGEFETIAAAMEKAPEKSLIPFVIYVKEGAYKEYVVVAKSQWNVILFGDGMNRTVVTGSRNRVDSSTAYKSATFIVEGRGFIAMDMTFMNTAGPEKNQAAAVLSKSDRSIFFRCSFHAFHNTLYTHSLRQFYRDCDIIGAVEFIFGDAAVVFQNCSIRPRQSLPGRNITITAQTRSDPNENTGIAIQSCVIWPFGGVSAPTFLGRVRNEYSRTAVVMTEIGGVVAPQGWMEMIPGTVPPDTIFFGEYRNSGPGSKLAGRVTWPGYEPRMSDSEAKLFSVGSLIQGSTWINI